MSETRKPFDFRANGAAAARLWSNELAKSITVLCPICDGWVSGPRQRPFFEAFPLKPIVECLCDPAAREAKWQELAKQREAERSSEREAKRQKWITFFSQFIGASLEGVEYHALDPDDHSRTLTEETLVLSFSNGLTMTIKSGANGYEVDDSFFSITDETPEVTE